jgi:hypothetical protein
MKKQEAKEKPGDSKGQSQKQGQNEQENENHNRSQKQVWKGPDDSRKPSSKQDGKSSDPDYEESFNDGR